MSSTAPSFSGDAGLGGWMTFGASSMLTVVELEEIVTGIRTLQSSSLATPTGRRISVTGEDGSAAEAFLKKALFRLAKVLADQEVAQRFEHEQGLDLLGFALVTLRGASLSYGINALRTYSRHEFALDGLMESATLQAQLWSLLKTNQGVQPAVMKALLTLLTEVVQRSPNGFAFVFSSEKDANSFSFPLLMAACLGKNAGLDVQIASLKLINSLLSTAREQAKFLFVIDQLASGPAFQQALDALKSDPSPALRDELAVLASTRAAGFKNGQVVSAGQSKDIASLKAQVADISALATEYRSTCARLEGELKNYRRREPLVQLLWAEIQQLRGALNVAISAGFAYDLSDPSSRYVKPAHFAYIDRLDVSRWTGGGHGEGASYAQPKEPSSSTVGGGGARDGAAATSNAAQQARSHAGMRSGDDAEAIHDSLQSGFTGPLAGGPASTPGAISYDMPAEPAPGAPMAPPMAPGAPGAPPMAPGAPGAPPMAPGAPGAPGAPPMAPGAPRAPTGPVPTKPVIKPIRKTKALHWTRILLPVGQDQSMWSTVASKLPTLDAKIPPKELDALFADVKKERPVDDVASPSSSASASTPKSTTSTSGGGGGGSAVSKRENMRFLSDKRFNAVAIMLSFLPSTELVISAVQKLDLAALDKDQVAALHKQMPSDEEIAAITASGCAPSELAKPEQFLLALSSAIPCVNARVEAWHFTNLFAEHVEDLRTPFTIVQAAINAVRTSKCLPLLCALVLHAGNYINGGTARGQADGFDLAVLSRLHMIKSTSGDTMLAFVVGKVLDLEGVEFGNKFLDELAPCRAAGEFPLRPALAAATRFQGAIKTHRNLTALVTAGSDSRVDPFNSVMERFTKSSEAAGSDLKELGAKCNESFGQLLFYLNPGQDAATAAKTQSEELFQTLSEFAANVAECAQARKDALEEAKQQAKQAEIRERQQAVRAKAAAEKATAAAAVASPKK